MNMLRRLELNIARGLFNLPPAWQLRLSGRGQLELDGQKLHPEMQLLLASRRWQGAPQSLRAADVARARAAMRFATLRYADAPEVQSVRELSVDGPSGTRLPMRLYSPHAREPRPLLLFLHGGGFALGDLDTHDLPCRLLCRDASVHVLAVDYRRAPEHPFPAAGDDAYAALLWARENAHSLGADATRIAVGGDSAGGNLSAGLAQRVARDRQPPLAAQVLVYPATDRVTPRASQALFAEGFMLEREDMRWFDGMYAARHDASDPRISPLLAADLSGLAPAIVVTAGFDPLRDEGEAYAEALRTAGTRVIAWREAGLLHGYMNVAGVSRAARQAVKTLSLELRKLLER